MALAPRSNVYIIGGTVTSLANPVNSLMTILQDQKANGSTGGAWNTRTVSAFAETALRSN
jgi:hypothetical protein